jgi:hypothetical protein
MPPVGPGSFTLPGVSPSSTVISDLPVRLPFRFLDRSRTGVR